MKKYRKILNCWGNIFRIFIMIICIPYTFSVSYSAVQIYRSGRSVDFFLSIIHFFIIPFILFLIVSLRTKDKLVRKIRLYSFILILIGMLVSTFIKFEGGTEEISCKPVRDVYN